MEMLFGRLSTDSGRKEFALERICGFYHDKLTEPREPQEDSGVEITVLAGVDVAIREASIAYTIDGSNPLTSEKSCAVQMSRTTIEWSPLAWNYFEKWTAVIPAFPNGTMVKYIVQAVMCDEAVIYSPYKVPVRPAMEVASDAAHAPSEDGADAAKVASFPAVYGYFVGSGGSPSWLRNAIIYQIVPDRFSPSEGQKFRQTDNLLGICGGTISGITSRLDYIHDVGVNCLWLTPIFASPTHHGYDTTEYGQVEPRLGSMDDFLQLVSGCRARNMRIILDFAANHVSSSYPIFQEAITNPESPYVQWFRFRKLPVEYDCYYNLPDMPIMNSDFPAVREFLIARALGWLDLGCDGFRLDHAHGLSHLFWSHFKHEIRARFPAAVLIGEVTQPPDQIASYCGRLDGCLDFRLAELMRSYFAGSGMMTSEFAQSVERHLRYLPSEMIGPSFLDNHDMNRFLWLTGGDKRRLKLAALFQFTLPVPPIIYYGTEIGLSQRGGVGRLEEARMPMCWEEGDAQLLAFYRALTAWRKNFGDIRQREIVTLQDKSSLLVTKIGDAILVTNNRAERTIWRSELLLKYTRIELATDAAIRMSAPDTLEMLPYSGTVLRCTDAEA